MSTSLVEVRRPIMLNETGLRIAESLDELVMLKKIEAFTPATSLEPAQIQAIVQERYASEYFSPGDQIVTTWHDGETEYEFPLDIVAIKSKDDSDAILNKYDQPVNAMILQSHYALPFDTMFDQKEFFYKAEEALAAGTYNFTLMSGYDADHGGGLTYQFTTTEEIPAGGGIMLTWASNAAPASVQTFESNAAATQLESCTLTAGSGGTSLGTLDGTTCNHIHRVRYGYNRWSQSGIRQYLNSGLAANAWWAPQNDYDRPPTYLANKAGFMAGFSSDFLDALGPVKVGTALNYITDGGTSANPEFDYTYDTFFLPALSQRSFVMADAVKSVEGAAWPYWQQANGSTTPLPTGQTFPQCITYDLAAHTTGRNVWLRSAYRGSAYYAWYVNSSGYAGNNYVLNGNRCAPACVIY